jgi:6-pyruvoyl-tetrahydropterin synthase
MEDKAIKDIRVEFEHDSGERHELVFDLTDADSIRELHDNLNHYYAVSIETISFKNLSEEWMPTIEAQRYNEASNEDIREAFTSSQHSSKPYGTTDGYINNLKATLKKMGILLIKDPRPQI